MKYYSEEKQDFERFLIFLNIKTSAKSKKIELNEEQSLWNVMPLLYWGKNEKDTSLKRMWDKFQIFTDWYFRISFVSNAKYFFRLPWRFLNFNYVFKLALKLHWQADTQHRYSRLYDASSSYRRLMKLQWRHVSTR